MNKKEIHLYISRLLGGNSQNFLHKFLLCFVTLGLKTLRLV
jgi:hypothetical protein